MSSLYLITVFKDGFGGFFVCLLVGFVWFGFVDRGFCFVFKTMIST